MVKFLALVAALVAVASAARIPGDVTPAFQWSPTGRIVGGEECEIEDVPYQVSLRLDGGHYCGASIISEHWILTATHCVQKAYNRYSIKAGTAHRNNGGSAHTIDRIIPHEAYSESRKGVPSNDVALIHVVEPLEFDETRQPIELFKDGEESIVGSMGTITGWGDTPYTRPNKLRIVNVPIISQSSCDKSYRQFGGLPKGQICAAYPEGGKDSCQGDSGGPFVVAGRLAGIVSWGNGCALPGNPGVYTEVASYRDWIRTHSGL